MVIVKGDVRFGCLSKWMGTADRIYVLGFALGRLGTGMLYPVQRFC